MSDMHAHVQTCNIYPHMAHVHVLDTHYFCFTQDAAVAMVKRGLVDGERVCVMGGSHGGFLAAHLIGQFPVSSLPPPSLLIRV